MIGRLLRLILRQTVCRFFGHSATTTNDRDPLGVAVLLPRVRQGGRMIGRLLDEILIQTGTDFRDVDGIVGTLSVLMAWSALIGLVVGGHLMFGLLR